MYAAQGFAPGDLNFYPAGADRYPLIQLARDPGWRMPAREAASAGYEGLWFHFESCRPGHWALHCELYPRLGKAEKAAAAQDAAIRAYKRDMTELVRDVGLEQGWEKTLGAHLKRTKPDSGHPSSLIVWTFALGSEASVSPAAFIDAIAPIIEEVTPALDVVTGASRKS